MKNAVKEEIVNNNSIIKTKNYLKAIKSKQPEKQEGISKLKKKNNMTGLYFILPSFIGVCIFILLPFLDVIIRSFQSVVTRAFVGLQNYSAIFSNAAFKLAATNTLKFVGVCIPLLLVLSLFIAVLLQRFVESSEILKKTFLLPMAVPIASVVLIWKILFNAQGMINGFIVKLGGTPIDWMNTKYAFWVLVISYVWKNLGYNIILWLAGLNSISPAIYEAAKVDGANEWQCFSKITLPSIKPTLFTIAVLSLLNSFKVFREAYLVAGDYPHESMYMLQHLFNNWFRELDFDKMAAASVVMSIVIFILIMLFQKAWDKQD